MIDPFSLAIAGGTSLINSIINSKNQDEANDISLASLLQSQTNAENAQDTADRQEKYSLATRTDQYGNTLRYDSDLNKWITDLTPRQKQLSEASQHEQLLGLTTDASRNRRVKNRQERAGRTAEEDYARTRAEFMYDKPHSEDSIQNELLQLLVGSAKGAASRANRSQNTNAMRGIGDYTNTNSGSENLGSQLSDLMLKARQSAYTESAAREGAHSSKYLPILQSLQSTMSGGGNSAIQLSDAGAGISGQQSGLAQLMQTALSSGQQSVNQANSGVNDASKTLAALMSKTGTGIKDFGSLYSALSGTKSGNTNAQLQKLIDEQNSQVPIGQSAYF